MVQYDPLYKNLFNHPRLVEDLLCEVLHPDVVDALDFTTLRKVSGEVITKALKRRFIDRVWQVGTTGGAPPLVVVLEFQSAIDPDMGLRMLVYSGLLVQELILYERYDAGSKRRYPTVLPLLLYNGRQPWNAAVDVRQCFGAIAGAMLEYQPAQHYLLVEERRWVGRLPQRRALFRALVNIIHGESAGQAGAALIAVDGWLDDDCDRELKQAYVDLFLDSARRAYQDFDRLPEGMNMAQLHNVLLDSMRRWPVEWVEKGRQEGIQEGRQEGLAEGFRLVLQDQLSQKFGELPPSVSERIEQADHPQLQKWIGRVVNAATLDQIFSD